MKPTPPSLRLKTLNPKAQALNTHLLKPNAGFCPSALRTRYAGCSALVGQLQSFASFGGLLKHVL